MRYEFVAIPDADVPPAADPAYRHLLDTYASETNKTPSVWRAVSCWWRRRGIEPLVQGNSTRGQLQA